MSDPAQEFITARLMFAVVDLQAQPMPMAIAKFWRLNHAGAFRQALIAVDPAAAVRYAVRTVEEAKVSGKGAKGTNPPAQV